MTTSTSESSNSSFITRPYDGDLKQDLFIMMDKVREMYEDGSKSSRLREQLNSMNSMKEEKQLLSDRLQEMETKLHIGNMNLKRMHELESQHFATKDALVKYQLEEEVTIPIFLQIPLRILILVLLKNILEA